MLPCHSRTALQCFASNGSHNEPQVPHSGVQRVVCQVRDSMGTHKRPSPAHEAWPVQGTMHRTCALLARITRTERHYCRKCENAIGEAEPFHAGVDIRLTMTCRLTSQHDQGQWYVCSQSTLPAAQAAISSPVRRLHACHGMPVAHLRDQLHDDGCAACANHYCARWPRTKHGHS